MESQVNGDGSACDTYRRQKKPLRKRRYFCGTMKFKSYKKINSHIHFSAMICRYSLKSNFQDKMFFGNDQTSRKWDICSTIFFFFQVLIVS